MPQYLVKNLVNGVATLVTADSRPQAFEAVAKPLFQVKVATDDEIRNHRMYAHPEITVPVAGEDQEAS